MSVFKSNNYIYIQAIDDDSQKTIFSVSSRQLENKLKKNEAAKIIGEKIAKMAKDKKINQAVFDRGRYKYHGIVKQIVETSRKNGLKI